jgi:hypothetical protein
VPIEEDFNNNTPSEVGGYTQGNNPDAPSNLDRRAKQLAGILGISPEAARALIVNRADDTGEGYDSAARWLAHHGPSGYENPASSDSGTGGSSSSGSSSGGSSGGSTGSAGPSPQDLRNAQASLLAILQSWQIPITPAITRMVAGAVKQGVSTTAFAQAFRNTKAYAKRFPGILKPDGTMRMTESQYISGYASARDYAASIGRNLSPAAYGLAIKRGNSPSEIKDKLLALDKLTSYKPQLDSFNEYLLSTGQIKKPLEKKDLIEFLMGGRKDLQDAWKVANTAFQLEQAAGVDVGKPKMGGDISYKELKQQIQRFEALGGNVDEIDFAKMGSLINEVIPKSDLYGAGITKKAVVNMMLNGKNAGEITSRVKNVLATYEAAVTEPTAQAPTYAGQVRLGTPAQGQGE